MSDAAAVMAVVLFLFFLAGIGVGIMVVMAMSARRQAERVRRPKRPVPGGWRYPDEPGPDDDSPDDAPWWQTRDGD